MHQDTWTHLQCGAFQQRGHHPRVAVLREVVRQDLPHREAILHCGPLGTGDLPDLLSFCSHHALPVPQNAVGDEPVSDLLWHVNHSRDGSRHFQRLLLSGCWVLAHHTQQAG